MKRLAAVFLIGLSVVFISAPARPQASPQARPAQPSPVPGGAPLVFRNQVVFDQQGLGLEYLRMLVPKDWAFDGGIAWNFAKNPPEAFLVYTVASPDGNSVIQQFPYANMYWSPDQQLQYSFAQMGSTIMQTMGAIDFLQRAFIPQVRQGVSDIKVIETQPLPAVAQQAQAVTNLTLNLFGQISPPNAPYQTQADAGRVKVEYTVNGRRIIEDFTSVVTYYITNSPTLSGMVVPSVSWSPSVTSFRGPAEEMPAKIRTFQIALMSRVVNPVWQVSYTRLCALVTREKLRQQQAIFARYQQIHKTLEECNDIIWQTYQNKSAAQDRMFDSYSQALRGVDTYVDPVNNWNVELPTGYDNAWTNGTDYVFSDSASFNPNTLSGGNWQKMTPKR
ncbi:MAG: hypothetical protein NTX99_10920 [Candidatus Aminicenantes bacterium]|nr:hypothetical protein [Candidatus Aminicenantes bacterium]